MYPSYWVYKSFSIKQMAAHYYSFSAPSRRPTMFERFNPQKVRVCTSQRVQQLGTKMPLDIFTWKVSLAWDIPNVSYANLNTKAKSKFCSKYTVERSKLDFSYIIECWTRN